MSIAEAERFAAELNSNEALRAEAAKAQAATSPATWLDRAVAFAASKGYAFTADPNDPSSVDAPAGSLGAHGYIATDPDLRALFIASGRGIKRGVTLDVVDNLDVAPTAARLLGLDLKNVDGRVLTEILSDVR